MRLRDYARITGISYRTAYRAYRRGELPGRKLGGSIIVHVEANPDALREVAQKVDAVFRLIQKLEQEINNNGQTRRGR